jgi:hypothetical protein
MDMKTDGMALFDPLMETEAKRISGGFVDDASNQRNAFPHELATDATESPEEQADGLQQGAQWWEQLLHVSGGMLKLPKCFCTS